MESENTFILVHDIFGELSRHIDWVVTLSDMDNFDILKNVVTIGQGISLNQIKLLLERGVTVVDSDFIFSIEESSFVHKKNEENVIITIPKAKSDNEFESFILLNHESEILDHVTGIHIPAMVLLEAARQSMLSIVQRYFLEHGNPSVRFTISSTQTRFHSFVFPAQIKICSTLLNPRIKKGGSMSASLESNIWQKDFHCATVTIEFFCHNEDRILNHEISTFNQRFCR